MIITTSPSLNNDVALRKELDSDAEKFLTSIALAEVFAVMSTGRFQYIDSPKKEH
jgi:hypothetical protein